MRRSGSCGVLRAFCLASCCMKGTQLRFNDMYSLGCQGKIHDGGAIAKWNECNGEGDQVSRSLLSKAL
eukprot:5093206-Amphidinium_carterae.1